MDALSSEASSSVLTGPPELPTYCRSEAKLKRVAESCGTASENVLVLPFDLTGSDEQLAEAVSKANAAFGGAGVDYLVHNAGEATEAGTATCCGT